MLNAIAWSYRLLEPEEQALFRRMSIFVGDFSMDFVEKMVKGRERGRPYHWGDGYGIDWPPWGQRDYDVRASPYGTHAPIISCDLPPIPIESERGLATLVGLRLVTPPEAIDGLPCFQMLETIREFGLIELERSGEFEAVQHAHAAAMIAFSEKTSSVLWNDAVQWEPPALVWGRKRTDAALPNIRAALNWAQQMGDSGLGVIVRIVAPLWVYWQTRGMVSEGRRRHDVARSLPASLDWLRAIELPSLAFLGWIQNDSQYAEEVIREAFETSERTGITWNLGLANLILALIEYRREPVDVIKMLQYVDASERLSIAWNFKNQLGACQLIYGVVARLIGDPEQALELFDAGHILMVEARYDWGIATARYFAAETIRDLSEEDPGRIPEATALLHKSLVLYWEQGDFWGAGGAMSGLACVLSQVGEELQAATYFGAASTLMMRVGASLLPTELMTHEETAAQLRERMGHQRFDAAFERGAASPEASVNQAITMLRPTGSGTVDGESLDFRLTERQLAIVRDLASGLDVAGVSRKRGRSISTTYDMLHRICKRLGVDTWEEIAPFALDNGLIQPESP
jgi:non-specific serine/threonine protein kinase